MRGRTFEALEKKKKKGRPFYINRDGPSYREKRTGFSDRKVSRKGEGEPSPRSCSVPTPTGGKKNRTTARPLRHRGKRRKGENLDPYRLPFWKGRQNPVSKGEKKKKKMPPAPAPWGKKFCSYRGGGRCSTSTRGGNGLELARSRKEKKVRRSASRKGRKEMAFRH